jgi:hypothetical protein
VFASDPKIKNAAYYTDFADQNGSVSILQGENVERNHQACANDSGAGAVDAKARQPSERQHQIRSKKDARSSNHATYLNTKYAEYTRDFGVISPLLKKTGRENGHSHYSNFGLSIERDGDSNRAFTTPC